MQYGGGHRLRIPSFEVRVGSSWPLPSEQKLLFAMLFFRRPHPCPEKCSYLAPYCFMAGVQQSLCASSCLPWYVCGRPTRVQKQCSCPYFNTDCSVGVLQQSVLRHLGGAQLYSARMRAPVLLLYMNTTSRGATVTHLGPKA